MTKPMNVLVGALLCSLIMSSAGMAEETVPDPAMAAALSAYS